MAAIRGAGASFKVDDAVGGTLTEIATYLTDISGDTSTEEFDGTTFSPGATAPVKYIVLGATERTMSVSGMWVAAAETFFSAIDGLQDLEYEYGPTGTAAGSVKIYGTLNGRLVWSAAAGQRADHVHDDLQDQQSHGHHVLRRTRDGEISSWQTFRLLQQAWC
jgi:hypothetical protein